MDRKERERLLKEEFRVFPTLPDGTYIGAMDHQKPLFINRFSLKKRLELSALPPTNFTRLHTHTADYTLCIGGARGGKTAGAIGTVIDTLLTYPRAQAIVGSKTYQDLKDTVMEDWRKLFTVDKPWDHPLIAKRPTDHDKIVRFINGSFARFIHFEDFERLRGREADIIHIDEASQIDDARPFQELVRRLSGKNVPVRQIILTTNPPESSNWLHDMFMLKQFQPDYDGPPIPIGKPCACQYCHECMKSGAHVEYESSSVLLDGDWKPVMQCPNCLNVKTTLCSGNQHFFRVIISNATMNQTLGADYIPNASSSMDQATYDLYVLGKIIELRQGKVYKPFSRHNILPFEKPVDLDKPIIWSFDFNISYQCSVIIQTHRTAQGLMAEVIDEIVLPECGPEDVAKIFMNRYPEYSKIANPAAKPILLYGDPSGLNKSTDRNEKSKFQIIYDILTEAGYEVEMMVKKIKGNTQIPVMHRVDSTNAMIQNADGLRRLFINEKCQYLIRSLEGVKYKEKSDPPAIDKQCDDNASRNPDKKMLHLLTHPTDALGYWIVKADPIIKEGQEKPWFAIPDDGQIIATEKGIVEKPSAPEEPPKPRSLMDDLRDLGMFGGDEPDIPDFWW